MKRFQITFALIALISCSVLADLKVESYTGLPFIKRDFEQFYLGKGAIVEENDILETNGGSLQLSSDLWSLTLGINTKAKWRQDGKVLNIQLIKGSAMLKKVSARKAYVQFQTPQALSKGEIESVLVQSDNDSTKIWLNEGKLDFQSYDGHLKAGILKDNIQSATLFEYQTGSTRTHKVAVNREILSYYSKKLSEGNDNVLKNESAIDQKALEKSIIAVEQRQQIRSYIRAQRSELIESIYEAVLEDASFSFSIPIVPPPR